MFVGIVGLTSAAMEEDDGFSTTFVFTHASASARAEKLFNKNRREKEHLCQIREILSSESSAFARAKGGKDGGKVVLFTLCCAFGNENTCFLHSSQVSYTPGFRPLATA